jgi:AcrR family transcriptional regulator
MSGNAARAAAPVDRRVERSRKALLDAFKRLILERGWDGFAAADVAAAADVGRSTLYEHFRGKEDMLAQSMTSLLRVLASAGETEASDPDLEWVLSHFWDQRRMARALLAPSGAEATIQRTLAELVEARLGPKRRKAGGLPRPLAAALIARAQLGLVTEWVTGRHRCAPSVLADAMASTTRALRTTLAG